MPNVYPMRPLGAGEDASDLLIYFARDPIGVEDPAALPADFTSINEGYEWTERVEQSFDLEHDLYGLHHTLKVPRGLARVLWNISSARYEVQADSYLQDGSGNILRGTAAFTATQTGGGGVQLDLLTALPSTNARISCYESAGRVVSEDDPSGGLVPEASLWQAIRVTSVPLATRILLSIYINDSLKDASFTVAIHDT